jgi:hypothetical protein
MTGLHCIDAIDRGFPSVTDKEDVDRFLFSLSQSWDPHPAVPEFRGASCYDSL